MQTTDELKEQIRQTNLGQLSSDIKQALTKEFLEKFLSKFSRTIDRSLFIKEFDRIQVILESSFFHQRCPLHIGKLTYLIYFIRRKLSREIALFPFKDHFDIRIFPSALYFPFGTKPILSILTHARLKNKYEIFDEEQILFIIRKLISEVELVKDSIYTFQSPKIHAKTLYFEIHKKSGLSFSPEEIKQIKALLKREIAFCIERLVPSIFMIRNEEEILKNILTLSREINLVSDPPQVMISFDQQTSQEAVFTIILVKILKSNDLSLQDSFQKNFSQGEIFFERSQIVRYLRKKYPLEANVIRIKIKKDPSLLRADMSLNFYLARQKISYILSDSIGEFRDYNGGIILKQREILTSFREIFPELSLQELDLLETFYYSLSPIEAQATISLESLKILFELFLEAKNTTFKKTSDFFLKIHKSQKQFFISIRISDDHFKKEIDSLLSISQEITFTISIQNTFFFGYFLSDVDAKTEKQLSEAILSALQNRQTKLDSRQVLKLSLEQAIVSLDPRIGGDKTSAILLKMLFEGLMRRNREEKVEYGIARQVEISSDQKTYLFYLRTAFWSDGSLISAHDFEYAWKKILSPTFKTPFTYLFYPIKNARLAKGGLIKEEEIGVYALDDLTLKVELEFPTPYFLELTTHTLYSPIHRAIDQKHPNWPLEDKGGYICNGAFQLKKNDPTTGYQLIKNRLYWDASNIHLDEIKIFKVNHAESYEMFQKGLSDWTGVPVTTFDPNFIPNKEARSLGCIGTTVYWYAFNTNKFPFNHKKIRRALSLAINREKLKTQFGISPAISPIAPIYSQIKESVLSTYDSEKAKLLFQEALQELNLSAEDLPEIPLTYFIGSMRNQIAQFIKEEWEQVLGIRCKLESLEWKDLFSRITDGDFHIGGIVWDAWINDPLYTLNAFRDANEPINFSKWENESYQKCLHLAETETSLIKRQSYYLQAEEILLEEMPVIPIFLVNPKAFRKKNFHLNFSLPLIDFKWGFFA